MRLLLLALSAALLGSGCVTLTVLEHRTRPRGSFSGVQAAWVDSRTTELVVRTAAGGQEDAVVGLGTFGAPNRHPGPWMLTYDLDDDEPLEITAARPAWSDAAPVETRVRVADGVPDGQTWTVSLADGRTREVRLDYAPSTARKVTLSCLTPLAVVADLALSPVYLLLGIPVLIVAAVN